MMHVAGGGTEEANPHGFQTLDGNETASNSGVTVSNILNYGAGVTAVGAAALTVAALAAAPEIAVGVGVAAGVYGVASAVMWVGSALAGIKGV